MREKGTREYSALTIATSEATYTIWKARCEWRITSESDPERLLARNKMEAKFRAPMTRKLKLDCLADAKRFGNRAVKTSLVKSTWKNLIPEGSTPLTRRKMAAESVDIG